MFVVVLYDCLFLNVVCIDVLVVLNKKFIAYAGDYVTYEVVWDE